MNGKCLLKNLRMTLLLVASSQVARASDKPVLNDWFALGSGCRARSDLIGDVEMKLQPYRDNHQRVYAAKFFLKNLRLSEVHKNAKAKRFGLECAIRLNINPPPGKKIVALHARTKMNVAKNLGYELDLLAELKLGPMSLGQEARKFGIADVQDSKLHKVLLSAGQDSATALPQLGCGEPKIIGFDYSWVVSQIQTGNKIGPVELADDQSLLIEAALEECRA